MLENEHIYVDRYICLEKLSVDSPEDFAACGPWNHIYFNNANTILIFLRGRWRAMIEGSEYTFVPGELCLLKPLEGMLVEPLEFPGAFRRLSFSPYYFKVIDPRAKLCGVFDAHSFGVGNRVTSVQYDSSRLQANLREIALQEDMDSRRITLVLTLAELLHDLMKSDLSDASDARKEEVRQIIEYLNAHYYEDIDVNNLARRVFVSRTKLARLVKEYTGCTIWDYILNKRILRSVQLLHRGMSNQEAARAVGFKNYSTYYKAFQRILGITPTAEHPTEEDNPLLPNYYDTAAAKRWVSEQFEQV